MTTRSWIAVIVVCMAAGVGAAWLNQGVSNADNTVTVDSAPADPPSPSGYSDAFLSTELDRAEGTLPDFSLKDLNGEVWDNSALAGKPWVINFWATWCPPCVEEIPSMNAAYKQLQPQGIEMLAINAGEGTEAVEIFLDKIGIDFHNILGDADTLPNWSVLGLPTTYVVDAEGNVVLQAQGPRAWDDEKLLQQIVDAL